MTRHSLHRPSGIFEQPLLFIGLHQAEQVARLSEVIGVVGTVVVTIRRPLESQRWLAEVRLFLPLAIGIRLVMQTTALIAIYAHGTIAMVAVDRATRSVDRNLMVIHPQPVALRIPVGEKTALQHTVWREADARNDIRRRECRLLDILEVVVGIAVELVIADLDQRVVGMRPDLGEVERMVRHLGGVGLRHYLHIHRPTWIFATLDGLEQIALRTLPVIGNDGCRLRVGEILDALLGPKVKLHPETLIVRTDEAVGVRPETVHMAVRRRNAAIAHDIGDLVQGLRQPGPEVPVIVGTAHVGARIALDGMIEVGEFQRIAEKEHRGVIAHHVPVALLGVELQCVTTNVALGIGGTTLACDGRKAREQRSALADLGK